MGTGVRETKESWAAYMREFRKKNPDACKRSDLKKRFGISLEKYNEMKKSQGHVCAICGLPETAIDHRTKKVRDLAVDHNHDTGEIRGLLCTRCNTAIGLLQDDVVLLANATAYLASA
jgi:hypothetical protein